MQKIVICSSLSDTTASSAVNVKNALEQYATDYFDSFAIETSSTETIIKCKIGSVTAFQLVYDSNSDTIMRAANVDIKANQYYMRLGIYNIYVMENAIAFEYGFFDGTFSVFPEAIFFMCKRNDGKTAIVYFTNYGFTRRYAMANPGSSGYCVVSIDRDSGYADIGESPHNRVGNTQDVSGHNPFSSLDGETVKNVFINGRTGFSYDYNNNVPFEYTLNGDTYTAFRGNCISVKGT